MCPEYCFLFALSSVLLEEETIEASTRLKKALEYCIQIDDKFSQSIIAAYEKHYTNSSRLGDLLVFIQNLTRGRVIFAEATNIFDDILEDYNSRRITPSRRIINSIKTGRGLFIRINHFVILFFAYLSLIWYFF